LDQGLASVTYQFGADGKANVRIAMAFSGVTKASGTYSVDKEKGELTVSYDNVGNSFLKLGVNGKDIFDFSFPDTNTLKLLNLDNYNSTTLSRLAEYRVIFDSQKADRPAVPNRTTGTKFGLSQFPRPPVRKGYAFGGWFTDKEGQGSEVQLDSRVDGELKVFARWIKSYEDGDQPLIIFDGNGDDDHFHQEVFAGPSPPWLALLSTPSRSGYTFEGWNSQPDGSGTDLSPDQVVSEPATYYARWSK
jgi:uncharacterized repeat protein (TIGR02543 family)